eukprot:TRINITY_DN13772_c0_g1_i6.p1 TRINITY_DN13772_c0_g1~~TRINITY_DN13772_c0_g1_i6.p1  ORF type:complete len:495 (-),score=109.87 TRINITY_DN13772_c0_g1_i6:278-1762(-)
MSGADDDEASMMNSVPLDDPPPPGHPRDALVLPAVSPASSVKMSPDLSRRVSLVLVLLCIVVFASSIAARWKGEAQASSGSEKEDGSTNIDPSLYDYGIVVDCGTKGSRLGVFYWPRGVDDPSAKVMYGPPDQPDAEAWYWTIKPGLATFSSRPDLAGMYMKPLFDEAVSRVPSLAAARTTVYIYGTENLRMLGDNVTEAIFNNVITYVHSNYPFKISRDTVGTITGYLEGVYHFLAVNALVVGGTGTVTNSSLLVGTLDMGSGSTQITFVPKQGTPIPDPYKYLYMTSNGSSSVYVASYSGLGYIESRYALNRSLVMDVEVSVVRHPCFLLGYNETVTYNGRDYILQGAGDWDQCRQQTYRFFNKNASCPITPCAFNGVFQPGLWGTFWATSNYRDVSKFLGLKSTAAIQDFVSKGTKFCRMTWRDAVQTYPDEDVSDLSTFCYGGAYVYSLLRDGYGFPDPYPITFAKNANNRPISWTLGLMVAKLQEQRGG